MHTIKLNVQDNIYGHIMFFFEHFSYLTVPWFQVFHMKFTVTYNFGSFMMYESHYYEFKYTCSITMSSV